MPIFDVHQHVGPWAPLHNRDAAPRASAGNSWLQADYRARIEIMDANGIDRAAIMPVFGYLHPRGISDTMAMNDHVAKYRELNPQRFPVAFGTVEPLHGKESLAELERLKRELKLDGVAWHHRFQGVFIDHPSTRSYLKRMRELELIPCIHVIAGSEVEAPWQVLVLAQEFSDLTFIALDAFSSYTQTSLVIEIAKRAPNIYWDTGFPWPGPLPGPIGRFVKAVGADRLLFGSALYANPPTYKRSLSLQLVRETEISEADKEKILWENAQQIFRL